MLSGRSRRSEWSRLGFPTDKVFSRRRRRRFVSIGAGRGRGGGARARRRRPILLHLGPTSPQPPGHGWTLREAGIPDCLAHSSVHCPRTSPPPFTFLPLRFYLCLQVRCSFFRLRRREWDDVKRRPSSDLRQLRFEMGQAPLTCGVSVRPGSAHKFEWKEERKGGCPMQGMRGGEEQEGGNLHKKSPSRIPPPLLRMCPLSNSSLHT